MRGYQYEFSRHCDAVHDLETRRRKADTLLVVLREVLAGRLEEAVVLDVGASTGAIDAVLAEHAAHVTGVDIDDPAIARAKALFERPNLDFLSGDAMRLEFPDAHFDVAICMHVYEHVPDDTQLMKEIARVLKPGGVCYFSAGNRLAVMEPHYRLPFLSWLPGSLADLYMRLGRKGDRYYEAHRTYAKLKHLVEGFELIDYTRRLIAEPERYLTSYMVSPGSLKQRLALWIVDHLAWLCPGYVWILRKPPR